MTAIAQGTLSRNQVTRALQTHPLNRKQREAWYGWDHEAEAWGPFVEAWLDRGFRLPPEGDPGDDPDTSLRSRLWPIAYARPNDLGRWVREAKGRTTHQVVGHVFAQWRGLLNETADDDWAQFDAEKMAARSAGQPDARKRLSSLRQILRGDS